MLVLIGGQKGGTGKTTIATNFAAMRTLDQRDVLLFDMDTQRTSTLWASRRDETGVAPRVSSSQKVLGREVANTGVVIRNELQSLLPRYEDIIIDAGGADNEVLRAAMTLADVVVFPILASEFDMWTFGNLSNLIASAQGKEDKLRGSILINKVNTNPGTSEKEIEDCQEFLSDYSNLYAMDAVFHSRVSIKRAQGLGRSVVEYKPHDTKAIKEIEALYAEVFNND